jgi:putative transposase
MNETVTIPEIIVAIRTMYRVRTANAEVRERRNQLRHPAYKKPELLATGPNQVWSWDITKLLGPVKWTYYYLYVLLDRGPSMTSQPVALLLATLGVVPSHSRPHVSNDNPFSEAQFKTLKYRPEFPDRFGAYEDAETLCQHFFPWYNVEPRHGALGLMAPHDIHYCLAAAKWERRAEVLRAAFAAHPERFPRGAPIPPPLHTAAWINKPAPRPTLEVPSEVGS